MRATFLILPFQAIECAIPRCFLNLPMPLHKMSDLKSSGGYSLEGLEPIPSMFMNRFPPFEMLIDRGLLLFLSEKKLLAPCLGHFPSKKIYILFYNLVK